MKVQASIRCALRMALIALCGPWVLSAQLCMSPSCLPRSANYIPEYYNWCSTLNHYTTLCTGAVTTRKRHYTVAWPDNTWSSPAQYYLTGTGAAYQTQICGNTGILFNDSGYTELDPVFEESLNVEREFTATARDYICAVQRDSCVNWSGWAFVNFGPYISGAVCSLDGGPDDVVSLQHTCSWA
jgi:hypothetical protein